MKCVFDDNRKIILSVLHKKKAKLSLKYHQIPTLSVLGKVSSCQGQV